MLPNGKHPKNELHIKRPEYSHIITSYIYIHFYIIIFLHNRNFILFYFFFISFILFIFGIECIFLKEKTSENKKKTKNKDVSKPFLKCNK